jgi:protein SCO1/2
VVLAALPLSAQEPTGPPAERYFGNVELINQDGEPLRLYRDLLHGKVVVIDTIFTACTGVCPVLSKTMERIQEHVGDRLGRDVLLLSITVDPENDTPQKLKQFAARWNARPGWHFLTGKPENVETALRKLGGWVEDREAHNAILIIGNEPTGLWKKALGMVPVTQILPIVDSVLHDPGAGTPPAGGPG